ncbi:MAG TPA: FecR family protein [Bacteroidota bacterium]|jgi:hypothetical protein|nr:FecR family protein [Bacteroidota bacterium]
MRTVKSISIPVLLLAVLMISETTRAFRSENATLALITKTVQDVTRKSPPVDWTKAAKGDPLISGGQVKTGSKSFAVVKFIDNSIIRVREFSELIISGQSGAPGSLSKGVQLRNGAFGFDIKKQKQDEQFQLTSPTSVASIRGTKGKLSGGRGNDTLIVTEGIVNLRNNSSNNNVDVLAGYIGFSNDDGTVTSRKATEDELADAGNAAGGGSDHELNLEMKDSQGNKKDLKIKYKK